MIIHIKKSAFIRALVLFLLFTKTSEASLPLTETIAIPQENKIEAVFHEELFTQGNGFRRESMGVNIGVLPYLSLAYYFQYIHQGYGFTGKGEIGDSFLRVLYYIGDYWNGSLHVSFLNLFRIPTGPNAYSSDEWRNLAFGNSEWKLGPVMQYDLGRIFLHFNFCYVFREKNREGFYSHIYMNPFSKNTYKNVFGLNFLSEDAFLSKDMLKNDYASVSFAVNTDALYPFIPWMDIYFSHAVYNEKNDDKLQIEAAGVNPLLMSAGCRYFFKESIFCGIYLIVNAGRQKDYIREIIGIEVTAQL